MQLSEQQRAELERRGYRVGGSDKLCVSGKWFHIYLNRSETLEELREVAEIAGVLGIAPPGYHLVPEGVAEKALPLVQALAEQKRVVAEELIGAEERAEAFEEYRALMALASALQGEVEAR